MIAIKNVKSTELNFIKEISNKQNKKFQKCLDLIKDLDINIPDLLPKKSKITISFELIHANSSIANGIRRCLDSEMEIISFDFDEYNDFESSDPYILCDVIKKQLDLLPINQEYNYSDIICKLHKENNTDEIIDVLSSNITIYSKNAKLTKVQDSSTQDIVSQNIILCRLRPSEYITIDNITICKGNGIQDAGKFSALSNITYKILDVQPMVETQLGKTGISALKSNPQHFYISYTTHRNIANPLKLMIKCCDTLINRLILIKNEMSNISNKDITYHSQLIVLETDRNIKKIQIKGEYWTIVNMIAYYCYKLTKGNIKNVSPALIHPEKEIGCLNITHPEFSTLIQNSIKQIIDDLNIVKKYF